jgi:ATP-binding cassette subfamily C protein CydC
MALAVALGASALIGGIGLTVSSAWLITMAAAHPPILVLTVSIVMVRFFGISRSVARYAERVVSHDSVFRSLTALRVALFEKISARDISLVRDSQSGHYVKSIVDDVERAQEYQLRVTLPRYSALLSVGFSLVLALWIFPKTLLVLLPVSAALLLLIPSMVQKKSVRMAEEIEMLENDYSRAVSNATFGVVEAKIYGYSSQVAEALHEIESSIQGAERKLLATIRALQFFTLLLMGSAIVGTIALIKSGYATEAMPSVKVAMAIFLPLVAYEGITAWYPNLFQSGKLLMAERTVTAITEMSSVPHKEIVGEPVNTNLLITDMAAQWDAHFMSPVNTQAQSGELLVIRGRSGSGKSTLAMALSGLLPYSGSAKIGGVEISNISELHKFVSSSLQRTHIFNTSLRENLRIGNESATDDEILGVLNMLELTGIELDTVLGDFGRPVSGGEAKRISVARALLSRAPIVILDEPTEHLDRALALRIEERITTACSHRTLIVITHSGWAKSNRTVDITRE